MFTSRLVVVGLLGVSVGIPAAIVGLPFFRSMDNWLYEQSCSSPFFEDKKEMIANLSNTLATNITEDFRSLHWHSKIKNRDDLRYSYEIMKIVRMDRRLALKDKYNILSDKSKQLLKMMIFLEDDLKYTIRRQKFDYIKKLFSPQN